MKFKTLLTLLVLLASAFSMNVRAQFEFGKTPDLHVEGKQLVDPQGHPVRFFGFMDTPSTWFNGGRWGGSYDAAGQTRCKEYFNKLFTVTTDTLNGAFCNIFRLHLEPAWLDGSSTVCHFCGKDVTLYTESQIKNNPSYGICKNCGNKTYYKSDAGKMMDPDGKEVGGEADVHAKSMTKLASTLTNVYVPIAESANAHGMYVIMRPPGVCPGTIKVGSYYQQYLMRVWDTVTKNEKVKKYSGWLSIELANEPVGVVDANGQDTKTAMRDFFQPIVDKIRENGFEGIIWVPGKGWQASYENYKDYPVQDANMGYAVHNYTGWYGGSDESYDRGTSVSQYINQFHKQVPVVETNPVVITEVDWSPKNPGTGHTNEHGEYVESNFGTWATGSTSKWGVLYKGLIDKDDNISMTLSATGCYIDIDASIKTPMKPVPAFKSAMENAGKDPFDGSGVACFKWYRDFYYQQYNGYSNDNITIKQLNTTSLPAITVSPGQDKFVTINATFKSGRQNNIAQSCTYEVADPTIAKVFHGRVMGLAAGETDITATYTDAAGEKYSLTFHVTVNLDNVTLKIISAPQEVVVAPNAFYSLDLSATFVSGRKENLATSCTYTVEKTAIAKVVNGKVQGVKNGETDIVATYTDGTGETYTMPIHVKVTNFPLTREGFKTDLEGNGSFYSVSSSFYAYKSAKNGLAGWGYGSPVSFSGYDSLKVVMAQKPSATVKAALRIYDKADLTGSYAELPITEKEVALPLRSLKKVDGKTFNLKNVYFVAFYTATATTIRISEVSLVKATVPDPIEEVPEDEESNVVIYDASGVKTQQLKKGVNIILKSDGTTRKVIGTGRR